MKDQAHSPKLTAMEWKATFALMALVICGSLGTDLHLASMPHIMIYMHTDKAHIELSVSLFLLGMGLSLLVYGPLSDQFGRKPVIAGGLMLAIIGSIAMLVVRDINTFLALRLLQGLGCGVCFGLGRIVIADLFHGLRLASMAAYMGMFATLSPLFAPAIGGYIQQYFGWRANFAVLGVVLLLALWLYWVWCPESNHHKNPHAFTLHGLYYNYKALLQHPVFVGCILINGIAIAATMAYITLSSVMLQGEFHLSPVIYGWVSAVTGLGALVGRMLTPLANKRLGSLRAILLGSCLFLVAGLLLLTAVLISTVSLTLLMVSVFLVMVGQALIAPNAVSRALSSFHDKRGAAGALYGGFQMLIAFISSAVVAVLAFNSSSVLAWSYVLLGILALIVYVTLVRRPL